MCFCVCLNISSHNFVFRIKMYLYLYFSVELPPLLAVLICRRNPISITMIISNDAERKSEKEREREPMAQHDINLIYYRR